MNYQYVVALFLIFIVSFVYAIPPAAPVLTLERQGFFVKANWDNESDVAGYILFYTPYPNIQNQDIQAIDLGNVNHISETFANGDAFYIAVMAYNSAGERSELSNIEHFKIDNKVVAFFGDSASHQQMLSGLEEAFADIVDARLESVIIDSTKMQGELFFGNNNTNATQLHRGYIDDPNVLAVVTTTTSRTFALTKMKHKNPPLIIATTATSTFLDAIDNVITMAPKNDIQADTLYQQLSPIDNQMHCYAVLLNTQQSHDLYAHDLYSQLLENVLSQEFAAQNTNGLAVDTGEISYFPQLCGTFMFDGKAENVAGILQQLDNLPINTVLYIGSSVHFKTFYDGRPNLKWISGDSFYSYEDFKGGDVTVLTLGGKLHDYGYDAGGFLREAFSYLSSKHVDRHNLLEEAKTTFYTGRTGVKTHDIDVGASQGQYDVWVPGTTDWEQLLPLNK